nr:hypothetical protein CFP56_09665 [Quercus suber]
MQQICVDGTEIEKGEPLAARSKRKKSKASGDVVWEVIESETSGPAHARVVVTWRAKIGPVSWLLSLRTLQGREERRVMAGRRIMSMSMGGWSDMTRREGSWSHRAMQGWEGQGDERRTSPVSFAGGGRGMARLRNGQLRPTRVKPDEYEVCKRVACGQKSRTPPTPTPTPPGPEQRVERTRQSNVRGRHRVGVLCAVAKRGVRAAHARLDALVVVDGVVVLGEDALLDLLQDVAVGATRRRDGLQLAQEADGALEQLAEPLAGHQGGRAGDLR